MGTYGVIDVIVKLCFRCSGRFSNCKFLAMVFFVVLAGLEFFLNGLLPQLWEVTFESVLFEFIILGELIWRTRFCLILIIVSFSLITLSLLAPRSL